MKLPKAAAATSRLLVLESVGSTNDELARRAKGRSAAEWPEFSVIATDRQTAGRGRLGRSWNAPPGTMLAVSVVLRPLESGMTRPDSFGWLSLLAGVAMTGSLRDCGVAAALKWPNDVLIEDRKVCGILAEALADGLVIVGAGVNLTLTEAQLPVPTATSMLIAGGNTDADTVLAGYLTGLRKLYGRLVTAGGDAEASGVLQDVAEACSTLGQAVRVTLPDGEDLLGRAERLDANGRLVIDSKGRRTAVSAGDVTHLRY